MRSAPLRWHHGVRVRAPRAGAKQSTPGGTLTYSPIDEVGVTLSVARIYHGVTVSDWDLSLSIENYAEQVLEPQVGAVANQAEAAVAALLNPLPVDLSVIGGDAYRTLLDAREALSEADVPPGDRFVLASPAFVTLLLDDDRIVRADASGSPSALRDAIVTRVAGFTVVETASLNPGSAVALHRSGLAVGTRTPVAAQGAGSSATATVDGMALNVTHSWDSSVGRDVSLASTFFAAGLVYEDGTDATELTRVGKLTTGTSSWYPVPRSGGR